MVVQMNPSAAMRFTNEHGDIPEVVRKVDPTQPHAHLSGPPLPVHAVSEGEENGPALGHPHRDRVYLQHG